MHRQVAGQVLLVCLGKAGPADDSGVVDQDVEAPESVHPRLDRSARAGRRGDVVGVGHGRATQFRDLVGHLGRRAGVRPHAVHRPAEVVDHDGGAPRGEQERIGPSDAASRTGDDGDTAVEATFAGTQNGQAATGALKPRSPPSVPPIIASRSASGIPTNCSAMSWRLPRKVPSAWG